MKERKDLVANIILKSIIFLAMITSLFFVLQPFNNGIVIGKTSEDILTYSNISLTLGKSLIIVSIVLTILGFILFILKSTISVVGNKVIDFKKYKINPLYNNIYKIVELVLYTLLLILGIYLLILMPLSYDKYNNYAFSFSIAIVILAFTVIINIIFNYFTRNNEKEEVTISIIAEGAVMAALAVVLSLISKMIPGLQMPNGGSFSLSMLPLLIFGFRRGFLLGTMLGVLYGIVNLITDGLIIHWGSIFFDYIIPFGLVAGIAGIFKKQAEKGLIVYLVIGVLLAGLARYVAHGLSGVIFFSEYAGDANPWFYSFIVYNLPYMAVSTAGSLVFILLLQNRFINLENRIQ